MITFNKKYHTRIAPSPTGSLHLGTARTAYFNWLAAKASGGSFLLRIDDTDLSRNKPEHVTEIIDALNWLNLDSYTCIKQSDRLSRYRSLANELVLKNFAMIDGAAIRLNERNVKEYIPSFWQDNSAGTIKITEQDVGSIQNLVLIKSDGMPTYNFASVVDDIDLAINLIIRGVDHIGNTAKQITLYNILGAELPDYAHVGLLFQNKKKLSKRDHAGSILDLKEAGYDADAVLNFMLRLGWGPKVDDKSTATLSKEQAVSLFLQGGNLKSSPANVDVDKLNSFNRKYLAKKGV